MDQSHQGFASFTINISPQAPSVSHAPAAAAPLGENDNNNASTQIDISKLLRQTRNNSSPTYESATLSSSSSSSSPNGRQLLRRLAAQSSHSIGSGLFSTSNGDNSFSDSLSNALPTVAATTTYQAQPAAPFTSLSAPTLPPSPNPPPAKHTSASAPGPVGNNVGASTSSGAKQVVAHIENLNRRRFQWTQWGTYAAMGACVLGLVLAIFVVTLFQTTRQLRLELTDMQKRQLGAISLSNIVQQQQQTTDPLLGDFALGNPAAKRRQKTSSDDPHHQQQQLTTTTNSNDVQYSWYVPEPFVFQSVRRDWSKRWPEIQFNKTVGYSLCCRWREQLVCGLEAIGGAIEESDDDGDVHLVVPQTKLSLPTEHLCWVRFLVADDASKEEK
jgi:hypothetical protein